MPDLIQLAELYRSAGWMSQSDAPESLQKNLEGSYAWCTAWDGWANDPVNGKGIWFGHGKRANISFSDGHCESLTKDEVHNGMFYMIDDR